MHFVSKPNTDINLCISDGNKHITSRQNTQFLGLIIDTTISWKTHSDDLLSK